MIDNKSIPSPQTQPEIQITKEDITVQSVKKIFDTSPLAYKRLITFPDWLMVMDGLKAATDYGFVGKTWNEDEFNQFQNSLENEGLKVTKPVIDKDFKFPFRQGYIYNPLALKEQTANSIYAPPYDGQMPIEQYIQISVNSGYSMGSVCGKIYSFPESAIADFTTQELGVSVLGEQKQTNYLGNEVYWYYAPAKADVNKREQDKKIFFDQLNKNPEIQEILQSETLKKSNEEWRKRLPDELKKH